MGKESSEDIMRCAIYARYSSDMQRPESIEDQVRQCQHYVDSKSWLALPEHVYSDYAESGSDTLRVEYGRLKEAARSMALDCVVVDDLSRLGRDAAESIAVFQELTSLGVNIVAIADGIETSSTNSKLPYYFKSVMNEIFLDDLKEKVRRGMRGQIVRGYSAGGRVYGYRSEPVYDSSGALDRFGRPVRHGVKILVHPDEAAVVCRIFELSASGMGRRAVARQLNDEGVPSPHASTLGRSGRWCSSTVRHILKQRKYIGDWTWNKTRWDRKSQSGKRTRVKNPPSKWEKYQSDELRIVSDELFFRVNGQSDGDGLTARKNNPAGRRGKYVLSGLLKCAECGASMTLTQSGNYSAYLCHSYWGKGASVCSNRHRVLRSELEHSFFRHLASALSDPELVSQIVDLVQRQIAARKRSPGNSVGELRTQQREVRRSIDNLIAFLESGQQSSAISDRLQRLEEELGRIDREIVVGQSLEQMSIHVTGKMIEQGLQSLRQLVNNKPQRLVELRQHLKNIFPDKLTVKSVQEGDRIYQTITGGLCGHREYPLGPPIMYHSGTGNRTPV